MSNNGLDFNDFDLDLVSGEDTSSSDPATRGTTGPSGTGAWNSSTSVCCATLTNLTEDCTWCNTCD